MGNNFRLHQSAAVCFFCCFLFANANAQTYAYPPTPKQPVTEKIWGKTITDEYRWLEDVNSQQVKDWLQEQVEFSNSLLRKIPDRELLLGENKALDELEKVQYDFNIPAEGKRYFYRKTLSGKNVARLFYRQGREGQEILLFDPAAHAPGKAVTFEFLPSGDGKKVALVLTEGGVEIATIRVLDVRSRGLLPDSIFPGSRVTAWSPDSKGFLYFAPQTKDPGSNNLFQDVRKVSAFNAIPQYPGMEELVVEEVEVPGHDGVMIPLSLVYNRNIKKDGGNVAYMIGYGSYSGTYVPRFNKLYLPLLNREVIIAVTHPRAAGKKGRNGTWEGIKPPNQSPGKTLSLAGNI